MRSILVTAIAALFCASNHARADLIVNGGFESPATGNWYVPFYSGSTGIDGWIVGDTSVDITSTLYAPGDSRFTYEGNQSVDLWGTPGPGSISQTLATQAGATYLLTFAASTTGIFAPPGELKGTLNVYWEGSLIDTITTPTFGTWKTYSYQLIASSDSSTLKFYGNVDAGGNGGAMIDSVRVNIAVPEPTSLAFVGIASLGFFLRRRRK